MPLDVLWLRDSHLALLLSDKAFRGGFNILVGSWHEVPAASIPAGDREQAALAQVPLRTWRRVRALALVDWVLCSDGRYYHPVVAERANVVWPKIQALQRRVIRRLEMISDEWAALRQSVFERDGFTCTYCQAKAVRLECDHILPVSRGGKTVIGNLTTACRACNRSKGAKLVGEWAR